MFRILQHRTCLRSIFVHRSSPSTPLSSFRQRFLTLHASESNSAEQVQHGRLYFDNTYPLKIVSFDFRHYFVRSNRRRLEEKARSGKLIPPESAMPHDFKVEGVEPKKKEGGMFLNFTFRALPPQREEALNEITRLVDDHLANKRVKISWFNVRPQKAYLVQGEPFIEDLVYRYPSSRLRVEFQGPDIPIETLYKLFRPYGLIRDISLTPPSSKELPRFAMIYYANMRSATSAKNCVHGIVTNSTRLNIAYDVPLKTNVVYKWMVDHPRISVPLIAALVAGISFDPIRTFFIKTKITQRLNPQEYRIYKWLVKETIDRWTAYRNKSIGDSLDDISSWKEREQTEADLKNWLQEPPETFIVVMGPSGSGKSDFIEQGIKDKRKKVILKCDVILNSRTENELLLKLARQVGYFPVFTPLISLSNFIDGLASATIGQKTVGFTSTTETEIKKILDALAIALYDIAPKSLTKRISYGQDKIIHSYDPADIPVIVIDSFMSKDTQEKHELWGHLAKVAAMLVESRVAHVIFISSNTGIVKHLSKALPNKTFNYVILSDAPFERSIGLVKKHVDKVNIEELVDSAGALGGRLADLRIFINKLRAGISPHEALNQLVDRATVEIRKLAYGDDTEDSRTIPWNGIQFWKIMKELAQKDYVSYDAVKFSPIFKGDDTPIRAMEEAELISITQFDGRPNQIKPGKPLYKVAFQRICSDSLFAATMELQTSQYLYSYETDKIKKYEEELVSLGQLFSIPPEVEQRRKFLLEMTKRRHAKVEKYQREIDSLKKVISGV
ncbi:12975_t:CDS:10 [Acaulospora morrowiae]|uniref:Mitochondrial escape protein 2 n=1 Tax=Acaulospora morrowiae TaxID=94023 RepID=A0A9N8YQ77_9GLOM|nr:12975_t:CDS:10 [Acaulospora morrowiae]